MIRFPIGLLVAAALVLGLAAPIRAQVLPCGQNWPGTICLANPDWEIEINSWGYADIMLDRTPGNELREYLSGEWAAAFGYKVGAGQVTMPVWLPPEFYFPDWFTNSDFVVTSAIALGPLNAAGLPTATSSVANSDLSVDIAYEMLDTTSGIAQGEHPASAMDPGVSTTSNRYILQQTYTITNLTQQTITNLQAFQFLHSLNASEAIYDDRNYGGPFATHRYDIFQRGLDYLGFLDVVTFHASLTPSAWEVGYYGMWPTDDHATTGKPSVGVHLSVEANSLNGTDVFQLPGVGWVGGAQRYDLSNLGPDQSTGFDVLLSIHSVPEPSATTSALVALAGVGLLAGRRRRRA